jgi:cell division septation protein DedD
LILHARQSEAAQRPEQAARLYYSWLTANPGASGSAVVFDAYFRLEQDVPRLLDAADAFLAAGQGLAGAGVQFARIARLMELAGRSQQARDAYLSAYAEGAPDSTLVSAFLLSLEMNDADSLAKSLTKLQGRGDAETSLLQALADIRAGDDTKARSELLRIADGAGGPDLALKALWVLYAASGSTEDRAAQDEARSRLARRFPGAPEAAMTAAAGAGSSNAPHRAVVMFPSPDPLGPVSMPADTPPVVSPAVAAPATAAPAVVTQVPASAPAIAKGTVAVQAGSFQMRENADDLVAELSKRGFSPVARQETISGKVHYRILAGAGLTAEQAHAVLDRLTSAGFTGFLVTEKPSP